MPTRRELLAVGATGATVVLAGCSGGGDDGSDDAADQSDDGSDGQSNDDGSDGQTDDDSNQDDGSDGQNGDSSDDSDDQTSDDGSDDGTDGDDGTASQRFADVATFPQSYVVEANIETERGPILMTGRFSQGDLYWEYSLEGQQVETYFIDEETYVVFGNQCIQGSTQGAIDREQTDPDRFAPSGSSAPTIEPTGTDTVAGDEVLVYEISDESMGGTITYYLLVDSGYPRRIETPNGVWRFFQWDDVEPIEPPEMDCQQAGG